MATVRFTLTLSPFVDCDTYLAIYDLALQCFVVPYFVVDNQITLERATSVCDSGAKLLLQTTSPDARV